MSETYDVGDAVRLSCTALDEDAALIPESHLTLKVKAPDGTLTTVQGVEEDDPGYPVFTLVDSDTRYEYTVPITQSGVYFYRFELSAPYSAADESHFTVQASAF